MLNFALGIDTGGTFTDGVIYDLNKKEILAKSKVFTIRQDLTLSIDRCLDQVMNQVPDFDLDRIKMVALSTTLATNSVVEGRGGKVGLIVIGYDQPMPNLPVHCSFSVSGGCDLKGKCKKKVDLAEVQKAIAKMKGQVSAYVISGYYSIRNPVQEQVVAKLVHELTGCNVVCAHQLSSELGFYDRTVTAILNARLIPLITDLIVSVKKSIESRGFRAPLMIVKGDGSLISEQKALERPIETILSGPAASVNGASALTGLKDALVVDMGGTTIDLAVLKGGQPAIKNYGALIGGWLTQIRSADITTAGLGGDSLIYVDCKRRLSVGPQRVYPLAKIVLRYPRLRAELAKVKKYEYALYDTLPSMILVYSNDPSEVKLTSVENDILNLVREGPHTLYYLAEKLDRDFDLLPWKRLAEAGAVLLSSVTPTDIHHLTGTYKPWDCEAARIGVEMLAWRLGLEPEAFIKTVLEEIYFKIAATIIGRLIPCRKGFSLNLAEQTGYYFLQEILKNNCNEKLLKISARLNLPLVAVGAPAGAYFPEVAKRLNTELVIPSQAEVASAVGTVSGQILERVHILIKPNREKGFSVHAPWGRETCSELEVAINKAITGGEKYAGVLAASSGARDAVISVERKDHYGDIGGVCDNFDQSNHEDKIFIESTIEILATGRPWG